MKFLWGIKKSTRNKIQNLETRQHIKVETLQKKIGEIRTQW